MTIGGVLFVAWHGHVRDEWMLAECQSTWSDIRVSFFFLNLVYSKFTQSKYVYLGSRGDLILSQELKERETEWLT